MSKVARLLLLTDALYMLAGALLGPIYALFVKDIGGDLLEASSTFAIFMLTAGVVTFFLARWEDKEKHKKKFVIVGYGLGAVGYFGYTFVNSTTSLFLVQAILGLSVALKDPAYDALFSEVSKRHLALAWGEWESMDYFVFGVGALLGGFVAARFGFLLLLWCMFGASLLSFVLSVFFLRERGGGA